jgi:aspartate dehydrogenase
MVKKVGLIGCGAIGTVLAEAFERKLVTCDELVVFDLDRSKAEKLKATLKFPVTIVADVDGIIVAKPKVIVEAAGQGAVREYFAKLSASGAELIFMSTGALLDFDISNPRIHFPAGAIGALDAISAAANAGIDKITLTTHKSPKALGKQLTEPTVTFEGDAEEAARQFPREMNVAATLALTVKPVKVHVKVVADAAYQRNTHTIEVKWRYGEMNLQFANDPHPDNPHTSALAAWAAIRLLQQLCKKTDF